MSEQVTATAVTDAVLVYVADQPDERAYSGEIIERVKGTVYSVAKALDELVTDGCLRRLWHGRRRAYQLTARGRASVAKLSGAGR